MSIKLSTDFELWNSHANNGDSSMSVKYNPFEVLSVCKRSQLTINSCQWIDNFTQYVLCMHRLFCTNIFVDQALTVFVCAVYSAQGFDIVYLYD